MRAAVLAEFRAPLVIEDRPEPACPEDGVVLRVLACGVCRSDWHGWTGEHRLVRPGHILGHEYCGEVVEAGLRARWAVGDRVVAPFILSCGDCPACRAGESTTCADQIVPGFSTQGAFAEYVAVPRGHNLARLPEALSPTLAAGLGCRVTTVWQALTGRAALKPGEWLAVHGTGGIGLAAVILGQAMGARVVAVDVVPEKLELALQLGAEAVVNARDGDAAQAVRDLTGGGAHLSLEALGAPVTVDASIRCLRPLGRHVQVGLPDLKDARMEIDMMAVYSGQLSLFGTRGMPAWRYPSLLGLIEAGRVDLSPLVSREVPLSAVSGELAAMDGPTSPGAAVVTDFRA
ncbi:zinc-binding dehydrogenase [Rubellimicrobium roseum]|uniref:Zinc-binding dehydrogenase n=1 Tax=Rubellimicrobium roseum TaxID=687525 RepID=A0A5C4N7A0_9RHOB|nr:alcohol dehydrogenase catalytic domain-containing protein [Rubellimicrobium roseum]TNC68049.1 zinc-binding dehydrogenase [Rubellimicrobium roseum]